MTNNSNYKICHITSAHPDGDIRIFHKEACSLAKAGYKTYLIVPNSNSRIENEVNVISFQSNYTSRKERMTLTVKQVYEKAVQLDADLYHIHDPELLKIVKKLKRNGKKVIYDVHEDLPRQIMTKHWIPKLLRKLISVTTELYENKIAKKCDGVVTATPFIAERFKLINSKTININNFPFIDELNSPENIRTSNKNICYVGGITAIRGISELIKSLKYTEDVKLILAGSVSPDSYLDELQKLPEWEKVEYLGNVSRKQVGEILGSSFAGIVTFHPLPNHVDAQPNKMFEYMSAELPVIGSFFPLWKSIIEDNHCGICVNPLDPKSIADGINQLKNNPSNISIFGKNGRTAILEKYNWKIEEEKLIAFYQQILNQ